MEYYKKDDRVVVINEFVQDGKTFRVGDTGAFTDDGGQVISWDHLTSGHNLIGYPKGSCWYISLEKIETCTELLVTPKEAPIKKAMSKISIILKKSLDPDIRALVKAGILSDDLTIKDTDFVLGFLVNQNKKELANEAREAMKEAKADK